MFSGFAAVDPGCAEVLLSFHDACRVSKQGGIAIMGMV